jgi:hypothetical protein
VLAGVIVGQGSWRREKRLTEYLALGDASTVAWKTGTELARALGSGTEPSAPVKANFTVALKALRVATTHVQVVGSRRVRRKMTTFQLQCGVLNMAAVLSYPLAEGIARSDYAKVARGPFETVGELAAALEHELYLSWGALQKAMSKSLGTNFR